MAGRSPFKPPDDFMNTTDPIQLSEPQGPAPLVPALTKYEASIPAEVAAVKLLGLTTGDSALLAVPEGKTLRMVSLALNRDGSAIIRATLGNAQPQ